MTIKEIKEFAKSKGIKLGAIKKKDAIIHAIQRAEGNFECYGTAKDGFCDQYNCLWRKDCLNLK